MLVGVIGGNKCNPEIAKIAEELGKQIAKNKWLLVCGGLGGVMEATCKGAKEAGGITIGILPTHDKSKANPYVTIPLATGLGYGRNAVLVSAADALVAVDGGYGTLSEIGLAIGAGKYIVGIQTWDIKGIQSVETPGEAIELLKTWQRLTK